MPTRPQALAYLILAGGLALAFLVASAFLGAVTGQPLALPALPGGWLRGALIFLAQGAVLALIMWRFFPALFTRLDKGIVERDERIAELSDDLAEVQAAAARWEREAKAERSARATAEARLASAGALVSELRANAAGWEESARHAANERDKAQRSLELSKERAAERTARALAVAVRLLAKLREARSERDAARSALAAVEAPRSTKATLPGVVAFLRELRALEKRSERAVPPLFRAHVGPAANSPTTFAAVRELFALLDGEVGEGGEAERATERNAEREGER